MTGFISFSKDIEELVGAIIQDSWLHARWLNTLSYMENCGARKIAAYEHPTLVKEEMLKHAAEEFRHALHLKRQIRKLSCPLSSYALENLLGGRASLHYLNALELYASRYLKKKGCLEAAYVLVTYAIEKRARVLYPIYEKALRVAGINIYIKSIILEEEEHFYEMEKEILCMAVGEEHAGKICTIESLLCQKWLGEIKKQMTEK